MSYYFRDKPRFSDRLRGNTGDDLMESLKRQFDQDSKNFFEPNTTTTSSNSSGRTSREREHPFDRYTGFPRGFPFDDDGFERRGNIRSHLDDLAARHPEFADHLLGPPWGDAPFLGTLRNRSRGSGSSGGYQGHPDDDARSQASGSSAASAASAASGASGVSSHGEPDSYRTTNQEQFTVNQDQEKQQDNRKTNPIPQYGLRNTVDIGQHRHNMENNDKVNRGQRSASAPPENRQTEPQQQQQQHSQQQQQPQSPTNQRFVSRVEITPQQQQQQGGETSKPQMSSKQQQPQQQNTQQQGQPTQSSQQQKSSHHQQGNVRHIPIFVEGRDEPVIPKNIDEPIFAQQQQRPHSPPQFHRPSHFNQHFTNNRQQQQQWPPQYHHQPQQQFYQQPHHDQQHTSQQTQKPNHFQQQQQQYRQQQAEKQRAQQQQQQQQPQQQETEPPRPKQIQPKEPLERVALVQNEVDSLMEQVKLFTGDSRKAKDYMYLDEMLTRELIKLDDIETEGKPNVRQARKDAIKSIQECIALLESKVPLPGQEEQKTSVKEEENSSSAMETEVASAPGTETTETSQTQDVQGAPIPLPPAPLSEQNQTNDKPAQVKEQQNVNNETIPTEGSLPSEKAASVSAMETQQDVENSKTEMVQATNAVVNTDSEKQQQMEVDTAKTTKSPKKVRKNKLPKPVSEEPIPLPAPEVSHT